MPTTRMSLQKRIGGAPRAEAGANIERFGGNLNPNELFAKAELFLVRFAVFVIFLVGLYKVVTDTLEKLLK
jgi:hypothetical protein